MAHTEIVRRDPAKRPGFFTPSLSGPFARSAPAGRGGVSFRDLAAAFLSGRNERTIAAYRQHLEAFADFIGAANLDAAAHELLTRPHGAANALALSWRGSMVERKLAPATINARLAALRSLVKLARTLGLVAWALEVENVKREAYRDTRGPGVPAFKRMLARASSLGGAKGARDVAILRLLFDLGLRRSEVAALDLRDVDMAASTVAIIGKGRTEKQALSLPEPTRKALAAWLAARGPAAGALFTTLDRSEARGQRLTSHGLYFIVRDLGRRIGVKARPHGLRHTAITEAIKAAQANGLGLEEALDFSRHADVGTLMIYRDRERNVAGQLAALVAAAA